MAGVSVTQTNGVSEIYINDKKVDLSKAKIIEKTSEYTVYEPAEDKNIRIVLGKNGGVMVTENGTTQILVGASTSGTGRPMTPEERAKFEQTMKELDNKMKQLEQSLGNLGNQISRQVQESLSRSLGNDFYNSFW